MFLQAWRSKAAHVLRPPGAREETLAAERVEPLAAEVVEAGVLEAPLAPREGRAAVTLGAAQALGGEEREPAARGGRERAAFVCIEVAVVGGAPRDERAFEGCDGAGDVREVERGPSLRERPGEEPPEAPIAAQTRECLLLVAAQAELDRRLVEHRDRDLGLERVEARIGPAEAPVVGHVGEAHRAARMELPRGAHRARPSVGEGARLLVTRRARLRPVHGEARVVEEKPTEGDLGVGHRVVGGNRGQRHPGRELPAIHRVGAGAREGARGQRQRGAGRGACARLLPGASRGLGREARRLLGERRALRHPLREGVDLGCVQSSAAGAAVLPRPASCAAGGPRRVARGRRGRGRPSWRPRGDPSRGRPRRGTRPRSESQARA